MVSSISNYTHTLCWLPHSLSFKDKKRGQLQIFKFDNCPPDLSQLLPFVFQVFFLIPTLLYLLYPSHYFLCIRMAQFLLAEIIPYKSEISKIHVDTLSYSTFSPIVPPMYSFVYHNLSTHFYTQIRI